MEGNRKGGNALILALVGSVIMFGAVVAIAMVATQESEAVLDTKTLEGARLIAEAGLNLAVVAYQDGGAGPPTDHYDAPQPFGGGTFQILSDVALEGPEERRQITVEGVKDGADYRIEAVLGPLQVPLFDAAILANDNITMDRFSKVDSYDARMGSYDPLNPGDGGDIIGNGDIVVNQGSTISGDLQVKGTVTLSGGSTVSGTVEEGGEGVVLDPVDALIAEVATEIAATNDNASLDPSMVVKITGKDAIVVGKLETRTVTTGDYYLHSLTFGRDSTLVFDTSGGPIRVVVTSGDFLMGAYCTVEVNGGNTCTVYMMSSCDYIMQQGANTITLNPAERVDLHRVVIAKTIGPDPTVPRFLMGQDNLFYGTVWAPDAAVSVNQGCQLFGAIIGSYVTLNQTDGVHYDESLKESVWILDHRTFRVYFRKRDV